MVRLELDLNNSQIERLKKTLHNKLRNDRSGNISGDVINKLDEAIYRVVDFVKPKGIYGFFPVLGTDKSRVQTEKGTIHSAILTRLVDGSSGKRFIVPMIATLGNEPDKDNHRERKIFQQWIFNQIETEMVEMVADMVEEDWKSQPVVSGLQYTVRISPGYCDWPVEEQHSIFNALDAGSIGVRLTPYSIMEPTISISAVSVAADHVPVRSPCELCYKKDCSWRRIF